MSNEKTTVRPNGNKIRKLRKIKKWTQEDMEHTTHLSRKTISQAENGNPISIESLRRLALALEVKYEDILADDEIIPWNHHSLEQYLYCFDAFIDEMTKEFTGRKCIFDKLNAFIEDTCFTSGYFVVEGDPGIGKSAFMSQLIKKWGLPIYHFNIATQSINTTRKFLSNICVRLIQKYELNYSELPEDFDKDGAFLNKLLCESSKKLAKNDQLIIVIDALDEVEEQENIAINPLFLPAVLPENVYIVASTRRIKQNPFLASNLVVCEMDSNSEENIQDICAYIKSKCELEGVISWKKRAQLTDQQFIRVMAEKSEGNFMYIRCVLSAMANRLLFNWTVEQLPQGLRAYYRRHWEQMRVLNPSEFESVCRPVICILAAICEHISVEEISDFSRVEQLHIREVLNEWTSFIHKSKINNTMKYRIYHSSFAGFLREEVDPDLKTYHAMIAKSTLKKLKLPGF